MPSALYAGQYFQNFANYSAGATNFNDGSTLFSTALGTVAGLTYLEYEPIGNSSYGELQLTESGSNDVQSAFELPDLDSGAPVYAFSVKWNSDIDGNQPIGDGFSFNFGPLSSLNLMTNNAEETGYGVGLCLSVQTDAGTNSGFYLLANGNIIASLIVEPSSEWGANNNTRHFWEVDWDYYSGMTVRLDGETVFENIATTSFMPEGGDVFVWGARCGTNTEEVRLDNIVAVTGGNLVQLPTSGPYFGLPGDDGTSVTNAFDGNDSTYYETSGTLESAGATVLPPNPIVAYALTSGDSAGDTPNGWGIFGSTSSPPTWNEIAADAGYFVNGAETRAWLLTNSIPYRAYELWYAGGVGAIRTIGELRFYALSVVGAPYAAWTMTDAPDEDWASIASSADGTKLAAVGGLVLLSTNSGATWFQSDPVGGAKLSIASSADGNKLATIGSNDRIVTNYLEPGGASEWSFSSAPEENWDSIACSSNGTILAAAVDDGEIYVSTNSGYTWTATASTQIWTCVCVSADGSTLAAAVSRGSIYVSTNLGNTWTATSAPANSWTGIASSADGTKLAAAGTIGGIYISTNSGGAWSQTSTSDESQWLAIASSGDGTRLAGFSAGGAFPPGIYLSTDSGKTWANSGPQNSPRFVSIASSSDGTKLAACCSGYIYTYSFRTPPSPSLNAALSSGYPVLSWTTTNGGNFVLQESTNFFSSNWENVYWPVTVTTNGSSYQVTDLPADGQKFYRLMAQ